MHLKEIPQEGREGIVLNAQKGVYIDDYINNPYKDDYLLGKGAPEDAGHIWLLTPDGTIRELAEESILINALRKPYQQAHERIHSPRL